MVKRVLTCPNCSHITEGFRVPCLSCGKIPCDVLLEKEPEQVETWKQYDKHVEGEPLTHSQVTPTAIK